MTTVEIAREDPSAEDWIPPAKPDGSGVGVNYADRYLKVLKKVALPDGRTLSVKRRGLALTLKVGDAQGVGLLRRRVHGPDVRVILREALHEAASEAGVRLVFADGGICLED